MKRFPVIVATMLLGFLGAACVLQSQDKAVPDKYPYDVSKQVTVTGRVQAERDYRCPVSGTVGSHITVKAAVGDPMEVHLAPASFLKDFDIILRPGDEVKIVGAKIDFEGKPALLARTVTVDNATYTFRDEKGRPLW